jgi:hypothetical protein
LASEMIYFWWHTDDTLHTAGYCGILRHTARQRNEVMRTVGGSTSDSRTTRVSCIKLHSGKQSSKAAKQQSKPHLPTCWNMLQRVAKICLIFPLICKPLGYSQQRNPVRKLITVLILLPKRRFYSTAHVPTFWPSRDCQKHRCKYMPRI